MKTTSNVKKNRCWKEVKKMKKITILLLTMLLVLAAVSSSYANLRAIFRNKKIAEELKLSDDQIEALRESARRTEKQMIQLRADMEMKEIDLREVMDADAPDEEKAVSLVKDIMELKTEQKILKIKEMISIKKILSPEQIEKLREIEHKHQMHRKGKRKEGHMPPPPKREGPPPE